jgi:hypothetical protein
LIGHGSLSNDAVMLNAAIDSIRARRSILSHASQDASAVRAAPLCTSLMAVLDAGLKVLRTVCT